MDKNKAEKIIAKHIKPIFSFALKRCKNEKDAEDLSQEIALKAFRILLSRDDVEDYTKYIWTIAHNTLANYYRNTSRNIGVSIEDMTDNILLSTEFENDLFVKESIKNLHKEIAYLSKIQRTIVIAYYYDNKKQSDIAKELNISLSLVKWHLFDAKRNLKRGIETMKENNLLQFNPIKFSLMGFNGSAGTMGGTQAFFRNALSQNIAYSVYREAKTINEIADVLGVSPVYIESEVEFLEEYGYLLKKGEKYLANMLIEEADEKSEEISHLHEKVYDKAAKIFANELFDELINCGILDNDKIESGHKADNNYLLWALIPYIAANSDTEDFQENIKFEEVATIRPDGAHDIANVTIQSNKEKNRKYYSSLLKWCGPSWTSCNNRMLWCCRSEWTAEKSIQEFWDYVSPRSITLLCRLHNKELLSVDEYTFLAQQGFIKMENKTPVLQIVWLKDKEIKDKLLEIGKKIKHKYKKELEELKIPFIKAVLDYTPKHLRKMQAFGLQYIFRSDGWFLLYCIKELLNNGKLRLPTEEQKKSLMTIATICD